MSTASADFIPVLLFVYARTTYLDRVLACLRENQVPLLYVFADGAKGAPDAPGVAAARSRIRAIDWCEVRLVERPENLGLGRNVRAGVTEVAARHPMFVVWEDDLVCVPGTYAWLCAALRRYADDARVLSITGWTHPRVAPHGVGTAPYFDARAECWVWASWARAWRGMEEQTAVEKRAAAAAQGAPVDAYGTDLRIMAEREAVQNTWAVRWLYHHFQYRGLCLRPPWSMVDHIGLDPQATNAAGAGAWTHHTLRPVPPRPAAWPEPVEHPGCQPLWHETTVGGWRGLWRRVKVKLRLA